MSPRKIRKRSEGPKVREGEGKISVHQDGFGFILSEVPGKPDVFVPRGRIADAMNGDRVRFRMAEAWRRGKPEGTVVKVVERAHRQVVGKYLENTDGTWVIPNDRKMPQPLRITGEKEMVPKSGEMVVAEITAYPSHGHDLEGKIIRILGEAFAPSLDTAMVMEEFHLPAEFTREAREEALLLPRTVTEERISSGRRDLRRTVSMTIDGEHAKDFDDAVSIERLTGGGIRLGVHIADVSAYVIPGSGLDREAYVRGTSVYFADRVVPMFPEALSNGICSLNPDVDRLTYSVEMEFDREGNRIDYQIFESVIHSHARLTYTEVQEILNSKGRSCLRGKEILDAIFLLEELALRLKGKRERRGSIDFDLPEPLILLDVQGAITSILKEERNFSNRIIEECMLSANETVAEHMARIGLPFVYRVHETPDPEKIRDFHLVISNLGIPLAGFPKSVTPKSFQGVIEKIKGRPEERMINHLMLRSMKQAVYSSENRGHFGLAAEFYSHFTSPIRRYPDLMVHRLLKEAEKKEMTPNKQANYKKMLPEAASHCSDAERVAMNAEREVVSLKKVRYMDNKIDQEYDGNITGATSFGLFVELKDIFVEGLVHISTLEDHYQYDAKKHTLTGDRFRNVFRLGDPVRVRVESVSLEKRDIRFVLLNEIPVRDPAKTEKKKAEPSGRRKRRRR